MIDAQIWYKSLNIAAFVTVFMGLVAVLLVKYSDSQTKKKKRVLTKK